MSVSAKLALTPRTGVMSTAEEADMTAPPERSDAGRWQRKARANPAGAQDSASENGEEVEYWAKVPAHLSKARVGPRNSRDPRFRFYWSEAGKTHYLVDRQAGRVVALAYLAEVELGEFGGQPVVLDSAWVWLAADDPDFHRELQAPVPAPRMSETQIIDNMDGALIEAQHAVIEYLNSRGLL